MFVLESRAAKGARRMSILVGIALAITGSFGLLLTLHVYVKPSPPAPPGFRIFGFPRRRRP